MNSKVWILVLIALICFIAMASAASKAAGSKAAGSKAAGSKAAGSKAAGSKAAGSKAAGSKAAGSKAAGSKAGGSKAGGSKAAGSGSKAAGSKAAGSKAASTSGSGAGISPLPSKSNQPKTICNTYSKALNMTNEALMYAVVNGVELGIAANGELLQYFNGTKPPGSRDFTAEANRDLQAGLTKRLVAFFGGLTGCTMDPHFPKFKKTGNFRRIHQRMGITDSEFDQFNSVVLGVMAKAGVSQADLTTMKSVLETFRNKVVKGKKAPPPAAGSKPAGSKPAGSKAGGSKAAGSKAAKSKAASFST